MTDTAVAADAITTILNSYKLSADKAADVSDLLFATVKRGKTTFAALAPAIGMVAAAASSAGLPIEEMAAVLATATRNGVRTRIAVTALNSILMGFMKATDKSKKAAEEFGLDLNTATLRSIGLVGVLKKVEGATSEQIAAVFENRRALRALFPVLQDIEGYQKDIAIATNRAGMTAEAYAKTTDTLSHEFNQLKMAVMDTFRAIGLSLEPVFRQWTRSAKESVLAVRDWVENNQEAVQGMLKLVRTLLILGVTLKSVGLAFKLFAFLMSPGGKILVMVAGLAMVLDALGLIDTGLNDLVGNMRIGTYKIGDYWESLLLDMAEKWAEWIYLFDRDAKKFQATIEGIAQRRKALFKLPQRAELPTSDDMMAAAKKAAADAANAAAALAPANATRVVGTFSGAAAKMLKGPTGIDQKQLDALEKLVGLNEKIEKNTGRAQLAVVGA
jgi:TP901 family phage tail tape measure protein